MLGCLGNPGQGWLRCSGQEPDQQTDLIDFYGHTLPHTAHTIRQDASKIQPLMVELISGNNGGDMTSAADNEGDMVTLTLSHVSWPHSQIMSATLVDIL